MTVKEGDLFTWNDNVLIEVIEVDPHGEWALIACDAYSEMGLSGSPWTKIQGLPFPASFIPKENDE